MLRFADIPNAHLLWSLDLLATILSFFGSLWMILHCFKAPSPKSLSLKLIAAIGCADLLYSIANLMSNFQKDDLFTENVSLIDSCVIEAVFRQVSYVLSIFFSTCVAVASYSAACSRRKRFNETLFFLFSLFIGLAICSVYITLIPKLFDEGMVISQGPLYCWFSYSTHQQISTSDKLIISMIFQGLPVIIGLFVTLVAYTKTIRIYRRISQALLGDSKMFMYRVLWYPAVLFLTFVPNVAVVIAAIYIQNLPFWVNALHLVLPHSIGFNNALYALLYGIQTKLYKTNYQESDDDRSEDVEYGRENPFYESDISSPERRKSSARDFLKVAYSV